jgi:hypothetical protein
MTTPTTIPNAPSFHVRATRRSTFVGVALVSLCVALGATFLSQVWSGPAAPAAATASVRA